MFTPTAEDIRVARLLDQELGPIRFIEAIPEENGMTDTTPEQDEMWGDTEAEAVSYPELPDNPHNHRFTVSIDGRGPMVVVRGNSAQDIKDGFAELDQSGFGGYIAAFWAAVEAAKRGTQQAPQGPFQGQQTPQTPPPFGQNVSVPAAPGYVGPPVQQQAPQWGGQQQGGFGGGAQQGNRQGPKPRPDWPVVYKINVPFQGKDAFKAFREQHKDTLRGKVAWAGGGDYWVHGDVAQGFAQYNPVAA